MLSKLYTAHGLCEDIRSGDTRLTLGLRRDKEVLSLVLITVKFAAFNVFALHNVLTHLRILYALQAITEGWAVDKPTPLIFGVDAAGW